MKDVTSPQSKAAVKQWIYYGLVLVVVFIIAMVLIKVFKAAKAGSTAAGDLAGALIIQQQTGVSVARQSVCRAVAADCRAACWIDPLVHHVWWVTDSKVVSALNRLVSPAEAALTCSVFSQDTGMSMKGDIVEGGCFVESNRTRIALRSSLT
jgi:hypothetical protein